MDLQAIYHHFLECANAVTDSREVTRDSMFFALQGENFNGNLFASQALQQGARYAVVDDPQYATEEQCLLVDNVLQTLQQLAHVHRQNMPARVVAITGSNGKTTTRELIHHVLSSQFACLASEKNYNNHIGVPLTLLRLTSEHRFAVVEMGANHPGEIQGLCEIALPDYGIITNIGKAHLEGFGSYEGVKKAKNELYEDVCHRGGTIFFNPDHQVLCDLLKDKNCPVYGYGSSTHAYCSGHITERTPFLVISSEGREYETRLLGDYNFENVMAALCVGKFTGVKPENRQKALKNYVPENNRSQVLQTSTNEILLDAYNANPTSMQAALENFYRLRRNSKTLILGDMFELGTYSQQEHSHIVKKIGEMGFQHVYLIGKHFFSQASGNMKAFKKTDDFMEWLGDHPIHNSTILIKGSRGLALEQITELL